MYLNMYINGELVESIEINFHLISKIKILQNKLEDRYHDKIEASFKEPEFFIEGVPSRMNPETPKTVKKIFYN